MINSKKFVDETPEIPFIFGEEGKDYIIIDGQPVAKGTKGTDGKGNYTVAQMGEDGPLLQIYEKDPEEDQPYH